MKSTYRVAVVAVMVIILLANPLLLAGGNPIPGRWEKVAETKPGEKMIVYTKEGTQHKYRFVSLDDDFLTCSNRNADRIQIELSTINKVVLPKAGKYAKEWAIWGAVGGAIGGAIYPAATDPAGFDHNAGGHIAFAGIGAILGALGGGITGAVVGASGETIYISKEAALARAAKD